VRNIRGEQDIAPSKRITILLQAGDAEDLRRQQQFALLLDALAKPETMTWINPDAEPPPSAIQIVGALKILVPLAGLIDKSAELERLDKEITKLDKEVQRVNRKLANPAFLANAPPEVVDKERAKVAGYLQQKADFEIQKQRITAI
jgi:valyl-tRNA synthetase